MRPIDADALNEEVWVSPIALKDFQKSIVQTLIDEAPTIETKQVKYFDEDEKVWKIGNIINQ